MPPPARWPRRCPTSSAPAPCAGATKSTIRALEQHERHQVAGYLAKYATKSTEQAGGVLHRVREHEIDRLPVREHVRAYLRAAFRLATRPALADRRLAVCAHAFGYRGHCLTKSRRYSTTFTALRRAREQYVHEQILARSDDAAQRAIAGADERIASFRYWRSREWVPALKAAGVEHRRIYDMRHTFATWSLAAGMSIFTLARRMGTSVLMIDRTYGHLAHDAEQQDRGLLEAFDATHRARGHVVGTESTAGDLDERAAA